MTSDELDAVYTQLCQRMTELGEANALFFLARFALLAIAEIDDADTTARLIDGAAHGIPAAQPR